MNIVRYRWRWRCNSGNAQNKAFFSQENVPELWELFSEEIMRRTVTTLTGVEGLFVLIQKFISTKCSHANRVAEVAQGRERPSPKILILSADGNFKP